MNSGLRQGSVVSEGYARAQWRKLKPDDVAAISDRLQRDPSALKQQRRVWSGTWLEDRLWLHEEPSESADEVLGDPSPVPRFVHAEVGTELWRQERERLGLLAKASS